MMHPCKLCGRDAPDGREHCHACVWKAKWPAHVLTAPEHERRRKRSHLLAPVELDVVEARAAFVGGRGERHETTLKGCSCQDFPRGDGAWPCKHIFRLAEELGLIQCEAFAPGEKDYTTAAPAREPAPIPTGPLGGKTLVFTGKLASMERAEAQARAEALGAVVSSTVSARTALLVTGEKGGSKLEKAQRLGVPVIDEAAFLTMLEEGEGDA